jgi:hypothetical protein
MPTDDEGILPLPKVKVSQNPNRVAHCAGTVESPDQYSLEDCMSATFGAMCAPRLPGTVDSDDCPAVCSTCVPGEAELVDGVCKAWCSQWSFCGTTNAHKNKGTDCRQCAGFPSVLGQEGDGACAPYSAEACRRAATAAGLELGGEGFAFEGSFTTKGCYSYHSGKYVGHAYYGTGAGDTRGELSGTKYRPVGFDRCEPEACAPYSAEACKQAATAAGLELGGEGFSFHGSFKTKGCYSYRSGKYEGHAYYGLGAGDTQGELSGAKYRPVGFDRCENPSIEPEINVGIFGFSTKYEAFVRTGTSCGAKANSASKGFVFRGHRLLCEDFESSSASLLQFP